MATTHRTFRLRGGIGQRVTFICPSCLTRRQFTTERTTFQPSTLAVHRRRTCVTCGTRISTRELSTDATLTQEYLRYLARLAAGDYPPPHDKEP